MRKRRNVLQAEGGHRYRKYKRRIRNMIIEITLIAIFIFVAVKFVKDDEEKTKVSKISVEEQKQIINSQMGLNHNTKENNSKEIEILTTNNNIKILKINLSYQEENKETIINLDIGGSIVEIKQQSVLLEILDENEKILTTTNVNIPYIDQNQQTRVNIVLNGDYRNAKSIKIHEEK